MSWRLGVDTGGTFTDVCLFDTESHEIVVAKVCSTPDDPGSAVMDGVRAILARHAGLDDESFSLDKVDYFAHGTTVATNALLQEREVPTGLITTRGFKDLLELGRQKRPKLYDFTAQKPVPLVSRDLRLEVTERIRYDGFVVEGADDDEIRSRVKTLQVAGVEAIAVCFLYSYLNPKHEDAVRRIVKEEYPGVFLSVSHEVLPEFREFERLSTTVVNAFLGPVMQRYLARLQENLRAAGLSVEPKVTQSNGGVMTFDYAQQMPVRTLLSGPSTGVVGAAKIATQVGHPNIITFDMGGTSSDVALVRNGRPTSSNGIVLDGRPVRAPMLDINTVGAGGGSIAWIDSGGHLKVGPQSAGAEPGPACYGLGNEEPTVTDANVALGILNQETLLGGTMPIDASLSFRTVERLGRKLGLSACETAQGIISVVTANMARAIRVISVQRGYDPADYALIAFGGAGPLHSARLAAELGMNHTIIPQYPGAMSALGMLMTELRTDYTATEIKLLSEDNLPRVTRLLDTLETQAHEWFAQEVTNGERTSLRRVIDIRYRGQNYELGEEVPQGSPDSSWLRQVADNFHDAHERRFGYNNPDETIELVTFRIEARVEVPQASFTHFEEEPSPLALEPAAYRRVYLPEHKDYIECPVYERRDLQPGHQLTGPCVIEQYDSTTLVLPNQMVSTSPSLALTTGTA